jgi:2-keto-3-deoxy-L-rhamnonate aldolase RhmA
MENATMKNRTKELLFDGKVAIGLQHRMGSPGIIEMFAHAGFCDFMMVDCEHAPQTPVGVQAQFQAMNASDATPIVRLPSSDPDLIRIYLDMGALGIFAPFITTAEKARLGAEAIRYPPVGTRGFGPARASKYGLDANYLEKANDEMLYIANIEHEDAIRNIDEILEVPGVDSFIIGPADLSISLGIPMEFEHPKFLDAIKTVLKAAERQETVAGTAVYGDEANPDVFKQFIDQGFRLLLSAGDEWILAGACEQISDVFSTVRDYT